MGASVQFRRGGLLYYRTDVPGAAKPASWDDYFGASARSTFLATKNNRDLAGIDSKLKGANAAQLANEEVLTMGAWCSMKVETLSRLTPTHCKA